MEDYYALLEIGQTWSVQEIDAHLVALNRRYRSRVRHNDPVVRENANEQLQLLNRAMAHLGSDKDKNHYDQELAVYREEEELRQPLSNVDLYQILRLDMSMTGEEIELSLDAREAEVGNNLEDEIVEREKKLIVLARRILLDPKQRASYDDQLLQRLKWAEERDAQQPVPLAVNSTHVASWMELEPVLEAHPQEGLKLLQNGEVEAWLRWSLGDSQRADQVHMLSEQATRSATPFMEFDELLRLVNGNRPLVLYAKSSGPGNKNAVTIHHAAEIPQLADKHWQLFITQFDYITDWLAQYSAPSVIDALNQYPQTDNTEIWLERLIYTVKPDHKPPSIQITNAPNNLINLGDVKAWSSPTHAFGIKHEGRGYLYGQIATTVDWLLVNASSFAGKSTSVTVQVDKGKMQSGANNQGEIEITPLDGRIHPIRIRVSASQKTFLQSVTGLFGGRR